MLPDVLKNNFLEDPALPLVKNVDDINQLRKRSIATYGCPKIMLHKKMATLKDFTPLVSDGLVRIINFIKGLMRLADKHNIKKSIIMEMV